MQEKSINRGQLPEEKKKKRWVNYALLSLLLALFALLIVFSTQWEAESKITKIRVDGASIIPDKDVIALVAHEALNKPKNRINLEKLQDLAEEHPYIANSSAIFGGSGEIILKVEERTPLAILTREDGNLNFLDIEGRILPYRIFSGIPDLPFLRNFTKGKEIKKKALKNAIYILKNLKNEDYDELLMDVSEIIFEDVYDTFKIRTVQKDHLILFGRAQKISSKIERLKIFKEYLKNKEEEGKKRIDLRWNNRVVVS